MGQDTSAFSRPTICDRRAVVANMWPFKVLGLLCGLLSVLCVFGAFANRGVAALGGHDLSPALAIALPLMIIGIGLLLQRKWAAFLCSICCGAMSSWLFIGTLATVPMPWTLINVCFGLVLLLPCRLVWKHWPMLR